MSGDKWTYGDPIKPPPINDGGPAFPHGELVQETENGARVYQPQPGMTLRDWFASQATQDDIDAFTPATVEECRKALDIPTAKNWTYQHAQKLRAWAKFAYADAMIAERQK